MPKKQIFTRYKDHDIRVDNTWLSGAELYVNDERMDKTEQLLALNPAEALLSTTITTDDGIETIEVFMLALLTVKIQIHANGQVIAGENFNGF
ncbi:MAG: hypothetical protein L3J05_04170 [Robiginitomaculum sp.]|nr:hypothetical protein [Robiginitomaculum sp.]